MPENIPVLLLHGLGQNPSSWIPVISCLPRNIQTYCPDLCLLTGRKEATYQNLYTEFEHYCMGIPGRKALCGISLGAIPAMDYAIGHPEQIRSLVLIAPQYKIPRFLFGLQTFLFHLMPTRAFHGGFDKMQMIRLTGSMQALDFTETLSGISCPALVVCGENDNANKKAAAETVSQIPGAKLRFIYGAGHEVNVDAPYELSKAIMDFY